MKRRTPERTPRALRQRLLWFLLVPLLAFLVPSMVIDYVIAFRPAQEAFDLAISDDAIILSKRVQAVSDSTLKLGPVKDAIEILRKGKPDPVFISIHGPHGELLAGTPGLVPDAVVNADQPVLGDGMLNGQRIRKASLRIDTRSGPIGIVVAEPLSRRQQVASRIFTAMILPNLLTVLATLAFVYLGVRKGLAPLNQLAREIARRSPHDLAPLPTVDVPPEVAPLVRAIDDLITDLRAAVAAQQGFLANAAHQLKTPLMALQTQLDLAASEIPPRYQQRMLRLRDASQRLGRLAHQLLALARSGPEANLVHEWREVDLAALIDAGASQWFDAALAKDIDLDFEPSPAVVSGSEWLLREMLNNLVDNAIRYTPHHGRVSVRCGVDAVGGVGAPYVEVEDNGPGTPQDGRARIFERFFRPLGSQGEGTGLGLAIVKEVADRHRAGIELGSGEASAGTRIRIRFEASGKTALSG
ncbi:MAG TPA: sensor histidine kinase [Rhodocyclaceae bacterium]|nr:sensor histidine kinase [Rhodocyclaceae bacterium]